MRYASNPCSVIRVRFDRVCENAVRSRSTTDRDSAIVPGFAVPGAVLLTPAAAFLFGEVSETENVFPVLLHVNHSPTSLLGFVQTLVKFANMRFAVVGPLTYRIGDERKGKAEALYQRPSTEAFAGHHRNCQMRR